MMQENVNKFSEIKSRVIQFLENKGVNKEKFFQKIGVTSANFRGNAQKTPLNSNAIENIFTEFPEINLEWLLTGRGEMLRSESTDPLIDCKDLEQQLNTVKTELKAAYEENGALKYQLKEAKATIERLKNAGGNVYSE